MVSSLLSVLPTSQVFTSGYVNTETILHFFYKITNERGTKTVFKYTHVKWFYGQSERAHYLNYFINGNITPDLFHQGVKVEGDVISVTKHTRNKWAEGILVHFRILNVSGSTVLGINFYQYKWKVFTHTKLERNQTSVHVKCTALVLI